MTLFRLFFALYFCALYFCAVVYCRTVNSGDESSLILPEICDNGPEVWCTNFTTSAQCKAVKHCVQTVWSKANLEQTDSCSTCISELNKFRTTIDSNATKDVIEQGLDYICELTIVTRILRKQCEELINTYVDENINELLDLLNSDIDSKTICHMLRFCAVKPIPTIPQDDELLVNFENIGLHFPLHNLKLIDILQAPNFEVVEPEASKLLGAEKCTWGPAYWCGNITTSKQCKTTSHCISNVWSKKVFDEDSDSVCQVCKDMVKQARDQLLSNETQEELKEVFEGSCKLIPIKEVRKECIVLADEFVPELTEMLASQMNPTAVCTVAGLCNSPRIDDLLATQSKTAVDFSAMDSCINCTVAFTSFRRYLSTAPKEEVLQSVLAVCGELSSYSDLCTSMVVTNFDDLYKKMMGQLQPFAACHLSGMCSSRYHSHLSHDKAFEHNVDTMLAAHGDDLPCDLCKQLVTHLRDVLVTNTTEEEFQQMLEGVCQQAGKYKDECLQIVEEDFKIIYTFLVEELNATTICTGINICPKTLTQLNDLRKNLISGRDRLVPTFVAEGDFTNLSPFSYKTKFANVECQFCKMIVTQIQQELQNPKYQKNIEVVLEKICGLIPSKEEAECITFISQYSSLLMNIMAQEADPALVCPALKLCPSLVNPRDRCNHCQLLVDSLINRLDGDHQVDHLNTAINDLLPTKEDEKRPVAIELKVSYRNDLIDMMMTEFDADESCVLMEFCDPKLMHSLVRDTPREDLLTNDVSLKVARKPSCAICEMFVKMYEKQLTSNQTEEELENMLDSLCAKLENTNLKAKCIQSVTKYVPLILDQLKKDITPKELCAAAKLCSLRSLTNKLEGECRPCEMAVGGLESILNDPINENAIFEKVEEVCDYLSGQSKSICLNVMDELVPQLEGVVFSLPPWFVCSKLKMCPYSDRIDMAVCSSPDLWCQDVQSAFLCDKLRYCKKTAWKNAKP